MSDFEDDDSNFVAADFHSIISNAQIAELVAVDKAREQEREEARLLAEKQQTQAMSLMQIAGLRTHKELQAKANEKELLEDKKQQEAERKRKEAERAKLENQFPPPELD